MIHPPEYCLDQAHGRISTLMEMKTMLGQTVWFVGQEVNIRRPGTFGRAEGFRDFARMTHLTPHEVGGFIMRNSGAGFKSINPLYEISPDISIFCGNYEGRGIELDVYNAHGIGSDSQINNAAFRNEEDAERYRMWITMNFEIPRVWNGYSEKNIPYALGIMTFPKGLVKVRNT
jgi:hypothetical protein